MAGLGSLPRWLCERLRGRTATTSDELLQHFMSLLRNEFLGLQYPTGERPVENQPVFDRIAQLLDIASSVSWGTTYEVQRLLVLIKPPSRLAIETKRRIAEAEGLKLPSASEFRAQFNAVEKRVELAKSEARKAADAVTSAAADNLDRLRAESMQAEARLEEAERQANCDCRAILADVFDDLQWCYHKRILLRLERQRAAGRLMTFGVIALLVVAAPFVAFLFERQFHSVFFSKFIENYPNYGLYTAISFGLLGAFFSRLISLPLTGDGSLEDTKTVYGRAFLMTRAAVGVCGAVIVYFFLRSNLINASSIVPDLAKLGFESRHDVQSILAKATVLVPSKDWCLLVIWSFLAGFSEKLVPDTITRAEAQFLSKKSQ